MADKNSGDAKKHVYDESKIKTLSSLEHIRLRTGMYIGRIGDGTHHDDGGYVLLKEVVEAQRAGIIFDCAHGRNHFNFRMIERALDQGFLPDTISTDLTMTTATRGPVWDLPTTMSKLLHFGMSLDDVIRRATSAPARIMGYEGTVGTLKPGANADISVFELRDGNFEMRDSDGDTIIAKRRLLAQLTVKEGRVWYERPAE